MKTKWTIIIPLVLGAAFLSFVYVLPVAGFAFSGWRIRRIMETVGEEELVRRTIDLPEVRAYVAKYNRTDAYINLDFHVGVVYALTECDLKGIKCLGAHEYLMYLEVGMDEWNGYPTGFSFACRGDTSVSKYGLNDQSLMTRIQNC